MVLFNDKLDNSEQTFEIAMKRAEELETAIVIATTTGQTAIRFMEAEKKAGFKQKIIFVTHAYGSREKGANILPEDTRKQLIEDGATVITAAHALSAGERGLSGVYKGIYPLELVAMVLRQVSRGFKVCYEIALMAADAGAVGYQVPVVCIGGSGHGADTACVVTTAYSSDMTNLKINEILCKPDLYEH